MSVATTLKALIAPLVAGGCYNGVNVSPTIVYPYAVIHEIVGVPTHYLHGPTAATKRNYQVDVFAKTPEQAEGLALGTIKDAISASATLQGVLVLQLNGEYDEVTKTHQYITEYQIWEV